MKLVLLSFSHHGRGIGLKVREVQNAVYDHARRNSITNGPHLLGAPAPRLVRPLLDHSLSLAAKETP